MKSLITPPLTSNSYIKGYQKAFERHINALNEVGRGLDTYIKDPITYLAQTSPKELSIVYDLLSRMCGEVSTAIKTFSANFESIIKSGSNLLQKREQVSEALGNYQKQMMIVRKEETEQNIKIEGEKLQEFIKQLINFNSDSNSLILCLLSLYLTNTNQLLTDLNIVLNELNQATESPMTIKLLSEEASLDRYIHELKGEIQENTRKEKERAAQLEQAAKEAQNYKGENENNEALAQLPTQPENQSPEMNGIPTESNDQESIDQKSGNDIDSPAENDN